MKIHIFGTCSGTEPIPKRHHTSFAFDYNNYLYWFDAGEACSYTAHIMGVDILKTKKICISHTHMDHIGGLPNLFWNIRKIGKHTKTNNIDLYIPDLDVWQNILSILKKTEENFKCLFKINAFQITDSQLFNDNGFKVTALHNNHIINQDSYYRSFGFLIETENKKIVYSGDTNSVEEFISLLPCDILIMETGHHKANEIASQLIKLNLVPNEKLLFIHHGLDILNNYHMEYNKVRNLLGDKTLFLDDKTTLEI